MSRLTGELYDMLNSELKDFLCYPPKKKAEEILQDISNSSYNANMVSKSTKKDERQWYEYHQMRFYFKAQKEMEMLNSSEMLTYISFVSNEIAKDIDNPKLSYQRMLDKMTLYNTAFFALTERYDGEDKVPPRIKVQGDSVSALAEALANLDKFKHKIRFGEDERIR